MLKEFLALNRKKLIKPPLIAWFILFTLIVIASQLFKGGGEKDSVQFGIQIGLIYATTIVVISAIVALVAGWIKFYKKRKVFNKENWAGFFSKNDFKTALIYERTQMMFTEEVKSGKIKGFDVVANIPKDPQGVIQFQFYIHSDPINRDEIKILEKKFKQYDAGFDFGFIFKNVNKKSSVLEIEQTLSEFASFLQLEKFYPQTSENTLQY